MPTLLETSTKNLSDLFANGRIYRIPSFQRDYSWKEEHWEDLWEDLIALQDQGQPHYMGALVLQPKDEGLIVIDGQQRLATLSLLILAVLSKLRNLQEQGIEPAENDERFQILFTQFLGGKDPRSLRYSSKLFLNENDDAFYQQYLIQHRAPLSPRKLSSSNKRLWDAYSFFLAKVNDRFKDEVKGESLAAFLSDLVAKRLLFIQILVEDELSAYTVFETLNARGLELTATDLLKNYLFSKVAAGRTDLAHVRGQWNNIIELVGMKDFPVFLRHYINSIQTYVRSERLFKALRAKVELKEDVFQLLDQLQRAAYWYQALDDPHDEWWSDFPGCGDQVRILKLFDVSQYKPLILAAGQAAMVPEDIKKVLRACVIISFRFNVISKKSTHELEQVYNRVAISVTQGRYRSAREMIKGLQPIYIGDEEFKNAFELAHFESGRKKKLAMYVLGELEKQLGHLDLDFETAQASLEHVLPENPGEGWEDFNEEDRQRFTYRLGNLTLLEPRQNREAANKTFAEKMTVLSTSQYMLTRAIQFPDWSPETISQRQKEMAKWATAVWRIDF
jgi:hypothetical protein